MSFVQVGIYSGDPASLEQIFNTNITNLQTTINQQIFGAVGIPKFSGQFYFPAVWNSSSSTTIAMITGTAYCVVFYIPYRTVFSEIGVQNNSAFAVNGRIGIYKASVDADGTIIPTGAALVHQTAEISMNAAGGYRNEVGDFTLDPGLYIGAFILSGNATMVVIGLSGSNGAGMGYPAGNTINTQPSAGIRVAMVYGVMPSTFPAGWTIDNSTSGVIKMPMRKK